MAVGNTPAAFAAPYASDIISGFDIDKPEVLDTLYRARGDQGLGYFGIIKALGFTMPVAQDTYSHREEDWIHENFNSLNAESAPGAGVAGTYTLSPSNLDSGNRFYPRKDDMVMFANEVTGIITAIDVTTPTAPVITVKPNEVTDDIGAIAAGAEIIIISGASSEGGTQPEGALSGTFSYENDVQIIKETLTATGTEMTNQKWFTKISIPNGGNGSIPAYWMKGQRDVDYRMELKMDGALLFSKRVTNTITDPDTGRAYKATEGLIPYIKRVGQTSNYTPSMMSVQKFNSIVKKLDKQFAPKYICSLLGIDIDVELEDVLVDYFKNTNIDYANKMLAKDKFTDNPGLAANVSFNSIIKGDHHFAFKKMPIFSHDKLYGATGYDTAALGVMLPMSRKKDTLTKKDLPTFGMRYKQLGSYSRMMEVWNVSGAGQGPKVIANDLHNHYQRCHIGAHHMAGNQMLVLAPN